MKKIVLIFIMFISISNCKKNVSGEFVDSLIRISYVDSNGNDLLDKDTENFIDTINVDIYYLKDGKKTRVYDGNMDTPENFKLMFSQTMNKYYLKIQLSHLMLDDISETYIDFGDDMDTIKCEFNVFDSGYSIKKVWYNSVLKVSPDNQGNFFDITK